jgi:hypothetical protein
MTLDPAAMADTADMVTSSDYDVYLFALVYKCHRSHQVGWNRTPYSMPVLRA